MQGLEDGRLGLIEETVRKNLLVPEDVVAP